MMKKEFDLFFDGSNVKVGIDGRRLTIGGKEASCRSASLDSRRRMPFWAFTIIIALILLIGTFVAVAVHSLLFSPIIAIGAISLCLFVFLATGRSRRVLLLETEGGTIELSGDPGDLKKLHFELAKLVLGRSRDKWAEDDSQVPLRSTAGAGRAGSSSAETVMDPDEVLKLKEELKGGLVRRDRIVARTCPHCEGNDLYIEGGMYGGAIYHCKDCDYVGPFIIEREITVK